MLQKCYRIICGFWKKGSLLVWVLRLKMTCVDHRTDPTKQPATSFDHDDLGIVEVALLRCVFFWSPGEIQTSYYFDPWSCCFCVRFCDTRCCDEVIWSDHDVYRALRRCSCKISESEIIDWTMKRWDVGSRPFRYTKLGLNILELSWIS